MRMLICVELKWLSWGSGWVRKEAEPGEDCPVWGNLEEPRDWKLYIRLVEDVSIFGKWCAL